MSKNHRISSAVLFRYVVLSIVTLIGVPFAIIGIIAAGFSDGGTIYDRTLLAVLIPLSVLVMIYVLFAYPKKHAVRTFAYAAVGLPLLWEIVLSIMIATEQMRGDWMIPLVPAVPQLIFLAWAWHSAKKR